MLGEKQTQKSGDNSTNIQTQQLVVNQGISYTDARQIALDVFENNFIKMSEEANLVTRERVKNITEEFLQRLITENPEGILQAKNPDFQYTLYNAQKEYAKGGDIDLKELLITTLINRSREIERSTLQILLNEAINIIPKLTQTQLNLLSIHIVFEKLNFSLGSIRNINDLVEGYEKLLAPLCIDVKRMDFEHLQYCGCVGISMGSIAIKDILINKYGGLFSIGFEEEVLAQRGLDRARYPQMFTQCLNNENRVQINAFNEQQLYSFISRFNIDGESYQKMVQLYKENVMNSSTIRSLLNEHSTILTNIYDLWEGTSLKNLRLTTMGIALGQLNLKRHCPELPISIEDLFK